MADDARLAGGGSRRTHSNDGRLTSPQVDIKMDSPGMNVSMSIVGACRAEFLDNSAQRQSKFTLDIVAGSHDLRPEKKRRISNNASRDDGTLPPAINQRFIYEQIQRENLQRRLNAMEYAVRDLQYQVDHGSSKSDDSQNGDMPDDPRDDGLDQPDPPSRPSDVQVGTQNQRLVEL